MSTSTDAIRKLLGDDDPETVRLVKEQLVAAGEDRIESLLALCAEESGSASGHAREVVEEIRGRTAVDEFGLVCHFFGEHMDLETACWSLAKAIEPGTCTLCCQHKLGVWGRQFLVKISGTVSTRERVRLLAEFVGGELEFRGNQENYYCERNSLLPRVIESRTGLPITLSVVYMMIASRAAMKVEGINLPGHFIARHGDVYFDPFHRGKILTRADIENILARQGLELRPCHLQAATPRQTMVRILANLLYVYDLTHDSAKQAIVRSWLNILSCEGRNSR